jgi:protein kinase A
MNIAKSATHLGHMAAAVLHHHSLSHESAQEMEQKKHEMATPQLIEEEKQFIANFQENRLEHPLPPEEIEKDPRNKQLGRSSRGLRVTDFELVRTLGTGAYFCAYVVRGRHSRWACWSEDKHADLKSRNFCAGVACEAGKSCGGGSR